MSAPKTPLPQSLPVLSPVYYLTPDRDAPRWVNQAAKQEQTAALAQAKAADKAPVSKQAGCYQVLTTAADRRHRTHRVGQPYAPAVDAHLIGHHVEVAFSFSQWPKSLGCRPAFLTVVVFGKHPEVLVRGRHERYGTQAITTVRLRGPRGRVISDLPFNEPAPYQIYVSAALLNNASSLEAVSTLTCPNSTSTTRGCAPPDIVTSSEPTSGPENIETRPGGASKPLYDLTNAQLLRSIAAVTAHQAVRPSISCSQTVRCQLTYRDSVSPGKAYNIQYSVAAEQLPGCWMATRTTPSSDIPGYSYPGEDQLAGCVHWPS